MGPVVAESRFLALHGFGGGSSAWDRVRRHLPDAVSLLAPDLPGHGSRSAERPRSFEGCLALLSGLVDEADRDRTGLHLVGYSLGARLALGLLLRCPERFRSATLIGVNPGLAAEARTERRRRDEQRAAELEREGPEAFFVRWQELPLFASQQALPATLLDEQRRLRCSHDAAGLAWALRVLSPGCMPDYRSRLSAIAEPLRLLVGELDSKFRTIGEAMRAARQGAAGGLRTHLDIIPGAGHNLLLEAPEAVARSLLASLAESNGAGRFVTETGRMEEGNRP